VATISDVSRELRRLIDLISRLTHYSEDVLCKPIEEGKWSIRDIISHIMGWDKDFTEKLDHFISSGEVMLDEHPDVQAFNEASVAYGRSMKPHDLLQEATLQREQLILILSKVPEAAFTKPIPGSPYTLEAFLQDMFIHHDKHHEGQIISYLQSHQ